MSEACNVAFGVTFPDWLAAAINVGLVELGHSKAKSLSVTVIVFADSGSDSTMLISSVLRPLPLRVLTGADNVSVLAVEPVCKVTLKWLVGILRLFPMTITSGFCFAKLNGRARLTSTVFCEAPVDATPAVLRTTL